MRSLPGGRQRAQIGRQARRAKLCAVSLAGAVGWVTASSGCTTTAVSHHDNPDASAGGTDAGGGTAGTAGTSAGGGTAGTAGASASGGTAGTAGTNASGGTAGTSASGGTSATGGASGMAGGGGSSGASATGGTSGIGATGGASGAAGTGTDGGSATGGTSGTAGTSAGATGGTSGTGGDAGPACVGDLSGIGTGDFRMAFTVATTATGSPMAIMGQRAVCDHGVFWDIHMAGDGRLQAVTDDTVSYSVLYSTVPINDGVSHEIVVQRIAGILSILIDGAASGSMPSAASLTTLAPLDTGTGICVGSAGMVAFAGTLAEICLCAAGTCADSCNGQCSGATPLCLGMLCKAGTCALDSKRCTGATPYTCDATGGWQSGATCSGATPLCDKGTCVNAIGGCDYATTCPQHPNPLVPPAEHYGTWGAQRSAVTGQCECVCGAVCSCMSAYGCNVMCCGVDIASNPCGFQPADAFACP